MSGACPERVHWKSPRVRSTTSNREERNMAETHRLDETAREPRRRRRVQFSDVPGDAPLFQGTDVPVQRLVDYLEQMYNLYAFLEDHLHISARRALAGIREYVRAEIPAHSERGRVSGTPVFRGTRTPLSFLFVYLADGVTVDEYLLSYPSPGRERTVRALQLAGILLEAMAYESALTGSDDSSLPDGYVHPGPDRPSASESVATQLHEAAWRGHTETVRALISAAGAGPDSHSTRRYGGTALHKGASQGHAETVQTLLSAGADPNVHSTHRYDGTPLHSAVWSVDPETARVLIAGGADADARDEYGRTPMYWATRHRRTEVVLAMLESGAKPDPTDNSRDTPLHIAASVGQAEMVQALLDAGADPNARGRKGSTPLYRATLAGQSETAQMLIDAGADPDAIDDRGVRAGQAGGC